MRFANFKKFALAPLAGAFGTIGLTLSSCSGNPVTGPEYESDLSKGSVGYQIFVHSFKDSDGDGIGDINGIRQKLPYLQQLGIKRIWLTPIFTSPSYHKYDCVDYYEIDPVFGTIEDFDALVKEVHDLGMEIILDLVINHTSTSHPWFTQSAGDYGANNEGKDSKKDWYVWSETPKNGFTFNSWAKAYYESNFWSGMPELNLDCPSVVAEIEKIIEHWIVAHDCDGFRLDAVRFYHMDDAEKNATFLTWFREQVQRLKPSAYVVGECWELSPSIDGLAKYAKSGINLFAFPLSQSYTGSVGAALTLVSDWQRFPRKLVDCQKAFEEASPLSEMSVFIANHDTNRWPSLIGAGRPDTYERYKLASGMYMLTPGTPWMYYGEEIAMKGYRKTEDSSDAPRRTGMIWGGGEATCLSPENYKDENNHDTQSVHDALRDPNSLLNHQRKIIAIRNRNDSLFRYGKYEVVPVGEIPGNEPALANDVSVFSITHEGESYYLVHAKVSETTEVTLPAPAEIVEDSITNGVKSSVLANRLSVAPYSSILLKVI